MKVYLTEEDIRTIKHSGCIELSDAAILQAYELQNLRYAAQDIAEHIAGLIEDAGKTDYYAEDWPMRVGETKASTLIRDAMANEQYGELYNCMVEHVATKALEELGIDPDTMEKAGR